MCEHPVPGLEVFGSTHQQHSRFCFQEAKNHAARSCQAWFWKFWCHCLALPWSKWLKEALMLGINEQDDPPLSSAVTIKHVKLCLDTAEAKAKGKHIPFSLWKGFLVLFPTHSRTIILFLLLYFLRHVITYKTWAGPGNVKLFKKSSFSQHHRKCEAQVGEKQWNRQLSNCSLKLYSAFLRKSVITN